MAYVTPEYVKKMQDTHDAKYWKVLDAGGKLCINKCDTEIGLSASKELLQDTLDNCLADSVLVKLYTQKQGYKEAGTMTGNTFDLRVKLNGDSSQLGFKQNNSSNYISGNPTWADMQMLNNQIKQIELDKLRLELEKEEDSPWSRLAEKLLENDALILALTGLIKKPVQQVTKRISEPKSEENIINRLNDLGFTSIDIENMADYLESNPGVIDQIKPIFTK
jgi:hypothetical protein